MTVEPVAPLVVRGLTVAYGRTRAVVDLDLRVDEGKVVGLVGPNACGKTTTLLAVLGLLAPAHGSVRVLGRVAGSRRARADVAFVPDEPRGLDELTVDEHVALVAALWGAGEMHRERAATLTRVFGLDGRGRTRLDALSHGQRRLVSFCAAFALDRPLVVVDEATAALDPEAVLVLREVVRAAAERGTGLLLATQDLHFAESVCDGVTLLSAGEVVASGSLEALRARFAAASLEDVFVAAVGATDRLQEVRRALDAH